MAISENKMQIVIDNYFKSECDINTSIRTAFEKGFRIGVKKASSAQPEQRWIPVTKRLPEKNVWVLVTFMMANGEVDTDIMRINRWDGGWDTHTFDMAYRETVIAWMPLPEPYGGEQE